MDYVPETVLLVLKDVPLDNTYSDTIYFTDRGTQESFFKGKVKFTFSNLTYQRVNSSVANPRKPLTIRVPKIADDLYDCNYIMFQNSNYGSKWFYAFIVQINYISPNNTEIVYEIDEFQTWFNDTQILPSFVEREHTLNDSLYANLVTENFPELDLYTQSVTEIDLQKDSYIVVGVNATPEGDTVAGSTIQGGIYSGVELHQFTSASDANAFIKSYDTSAKSEAIITVYMSAWDTNGVPLGRTDLTRPANLNGYIPKNNKLFTYPFCKMIMDNRQGQSFDFYYEYFATYSGANVTPLPLRFQHIATGGLQPKGFCVAVGYNGNQGAPNMDYNKVCEVSGSIQCAWTSNAFANWLSGEATAEAFKLVGSTIIGGAIGAATQNPMMLMKTGANFVSGAGNLATETWAKSRCPGLTKGQAHSNNLNFLFENVGFTIRQMAITPEIAQTVDDYFSMFGYATNKVKVPNLTGRQNWNYVKTRDVIIKGSIPVDSMAKIKSMFNTGIRLWHGDFVGNYSLQNKIEVI